MLKKTPQVRGFLSLHERDQKTIQHHWEADYDLVLVTKFTRFLLILAFLSFFSLFWDASSFSHLNLIKTDEAVKMVNFLNVGSFCIFLVLFTNLICEFHIILYRNHPVEAKIMSGCVNCFKWGFPMAVGAFGVVDTRSRFFPIEPSSIDNFYQIHSWFGRGYGYECQRQSVMDQSLKLFSKYDSTKLVNPATHMADQKMINIFIAANKDALIKELPLVHCQNIGLSKGYLL